MTQAAEIKELAERIKSFATAMEKPGADRQTEAASIDRCLVRIKALTSDIAVTVAHRPTVREPRTHFGQELRHFGEDLSKTVLGVK